MGPVEEAGKAAAGFMDVMKGQPLALALAICNIMLLGIFAFVAHMASTNREREFNSIIGMQREVQQLLYNCTPDRPKG
jgi:hypothetical protein